MPKVSGLEMVKLLKSTPSTSEIPIIFLTALSDPEQKSKSLELGVDRFLTKTESSMDQIVATIHELLNNQADHARQASAASPDPLAGQQNINTIISEANYAQKTQPPQANQATQ